MAFALVHLLQLLLLVNQEALAEKYVNRFIH